MTRITHDVGDGLPARIFRVHIPVILFVVITLFPFYWMLITSLTRSSEIYNSTRDPLLVLKPTLDHYRYLLFETNFPHWALNTTMVAGASTAITVLCSVPAGYSLARLRYRGASTIGWGIFVTYLVPQTLLFLPMAYLIQSLHLAGSLWALILTYPTFLIPFSTWLLIGYFRALPRELEESALVDGATRLQAMTRIIVPLALPGILAAAIFAFTLSWNEYLYALIFISDGTTKTIPVGVVGDLVRGDSIYWGELMAAALLGSVPVAVLYSFFVQHFVSGLTAGAVKG